MVNERDSAGTAHPTRDYRLAQVADLNRCWEQLLHFARRHVYAKHAIIPHQQGNSFYYLSDGLVGIFYTASCGRERLTLRVKPGCIFNEARPLSGLAPEGHFVCMQPSVVWHFPEHLLGDPDFISGHAEQISNLLRSMGTKILTHYIFLAEMGTGSHETHLCRFIQAFMRGSRQRNIPCNMTQEEVASLLGIHRTTLARLVRRLKKRGVISSFTARNITIEDPEELDMIANGGQLPADGDDI